MHRPRAKAAARVTRVQGAAPLRAWVRCARSRRSAAPGPMRRCRTCACRIRASPRARIPFSQQAAAAPCALILGVLELRDVGACRSRWAAPTLRSKHSPTDPCATRVHRITPSGSGSVRPSRMLPRRGTGESLVRHAVPTDRTLSNRCRRPCRRRRRRRRRRPRHRTAPRLVVVRPCWAAPAPRPPVLRRRLGAIVRPTGERERPRISGRPPRPPLA